MQKQIKHFVLGPRKAKKQKKNVSEEPKQVQLTSFFHPPSKTISFLAELGHKKCHLRTWDQTFLLGVQSGLYMGLGPVVAYCVAYSQNPVMLESLYGLDRGIIALIIPISLTHIILFVGEIFTGNTMIDFLALYCGECGIIGLLKNWFWSLLGNAIGAFLFIVLFLFFPIKIHKEVPFWVQQMGQIATNKVTKAWWIIILQGIIANWALGHAVWLSFSIHDSAGRILAMWGPIFAFAALGYEHCIANMVILGAGWLFNAKEVRVLSIFYNLFFSTIGNIIGAFFLSSFLYYSFEFREKQQLLSNPICEISLKPNPNNK